MDNEKEMREAFNAVILALLKMGVIRMVPQALLIIGCISGGLAAILGPGMFSAVAILSLVAAGLAWVLVDSHTCVPPCGMLDVAATRLVELKRDRPEEFAKVRASIPEEWISMTNNGIIFSERNGSALDTVILRYSDVGSARIGKIGMQAITIGAGLVANKITGKGS